MICSSFGTKPRVAWVSKDRAGDCNCCHNEGGTLHVYEIELNKLVVRVCADCMTDIIKQVHSR